MTGSSDLVRAVASENYVRPAIKAGKTQFSVAVKDIMKDLQTKGFPASHYPQVCTALRTGKFLRENDLEIERVDGPPSGLSTTVVVHYRVAEHPDLQITRSSSVSPGLQVAEDPGVRAARLTDKLRGMLKAEIDEYGGAEAFLRWVRSEDKPNDSGYGNAR